MTARRPISPSDEQGFTLIELFMAMLIMTVGLLGLLQSLQIAYQHNTRNRMREEGILVAEEQMNRFRQMAYGTVTATNGVTQVDRGIMAGGRRDLFTVIRNAQEVGAGDPAKHTDSKKLTVTVQWSFRHVTSTHVLYSMKSE
jgi:type IV pilus assembly protein PilV